MVKNLFNSFATDISALRLEAVAQTAYEKAFEAELLSDLIKDGISDDERQRLIALLGEEARDTSVDELLPMLTKVQEEFGQSAKKLTEAAEIVSEKQTIKKRELNELIEKQDEYFNASPEKREAIRIKDANLSANDASAKESAVIDEPDFTVPNFG